MSKSSGTYTISPFRVKGGTLRAAQVVYRTWGDKQKKCVVIWTSFINRTLDEIQWLVNIIDQTKYYIVAFALFGNGESSSPSNTPGPHNGSFFPEISFPDNAVAHFRVLRSLGVNKVECAIGHSMSGYLAYYWALQEKPAIALEKFICICGSARPGYAIQHMISASSSALSFSEDFQGGRYASQPEIGMRAFGRVFSSWTRSPAWYTSDHIESTEKVSESSTDAAATIPESTTNDNQQKDRKIHKDMDDYIARHWETKFLTTGWDANNILSHLQMCRSADDLTEKLSSIKAKALIIYCDTDMIVPAKESEYHCKNLNAGSQSTQSNVISSELGHMVGSGEGISFFKQNVIDFLALTDSSSTTPASDPNNKASTSSIHRHRHL